ncbi:MAG: hypothetical protein KDB70_01605 [Mycobacterium sp.]|nr:hypothetical protein [Mycobacterium sp.]
MLDTEITTAAGLPVTTPERTAFDPARRGPVLQSVQRLDAPARATGFAAEDALVVAQGHPRVRGLRRVSDVLDLVDKGGQSPKETRLRLVLIDGGFTRPTTQMPLLRDDRYSWYFLDLGWRDRLLAVEYDGEQHRTDPRQFRADVSRSEFIQSKGWYRISVLAGDRRPDIPRRVTQAGAPRVQQPGVLQRKWPGRPFFFVDAERTQGFPRKSLRRF